nr:uncharacterized protein LOC109187024 [Ipomoea batatas]
MEMALMSKNKMSFANRREAVPSRLDPKYYYWEHWVWKDLKKRFNQHDVFRIVEIQSQIHQMSCECSPSWKPINKGMGSANEVQGSVQEGSSSEANPPFTQEDCRRFLEFMQQERNSQVKQPSNLILPFKDVSCLNYDEDTSLPTHEAPPDSLEIPIVVPMENNELDDTESSPSPEPRRSTRVRTKPTYLGDYTCHNTTRRTSPHDISKFLSYENLSQAYKLHVALFDPVNVMPEC